MAFFLCQINAGARRKFLACRPRMVLIMILTIPTPQDCSFDPWQYCAMCMRSEKTV